MTVRPRDPKFYVVGGAVQPDRDCYRARNADAELFRRVSDGDYCHVLAERQAGKTSLAASTARRLRASGVLVALVDLTQASGEDPSENAGRWYYSIAYRIVRELRIKADVQNWWKERSGLTNLQRLREFFLEIVLEETSQPVAIFFDRIESTEGEPLVQDFFAAIRACYDARATDTGFQRLTFALFGSGSPTDIVNSVQGSPFEISVSIPLPDFSAQEMAGLLSGLGEPLPEAQEILSRVWTWTRGHPYLTQKLLRGLARRRDDEISADTVDELVHSQFLSPNTLREEPHLSAIADLLTAEDAGRTARLNLYGRIRKGVDVTFDNTSAAQRDLVAVGLVTVGTDGLLRVRNEIYSMVFGTRWVNQSLPYGVRSFAIAAAVIALVVALPIWYTEYLPRPYVRALSVANQDYAVAEDAYESLYILPGYGATANRLFADFLSRKSGNAETLPEIMQVNSRMLLLPNGEERAADLLADFWRRRAMESAHRGDRDAALVSVLEAMNRPDENLRRLAAELLGQDYRNLSGTLHTKGVLRGLRVDETAGILSLLDDRNNIDFWRLDGPQPELVRSDTLIAEERLELEERTIVERLSGAPRLLIKTDHSQPQQLVIFVRAPSGQQARLELTDARAIGDNLYAFDFAAYAQLQNLLSGELTGNWTLAISDMEQGVTGQLLDWGVVSASTTDVSTPNFLPQPIPEPRSTVNVVSNLGPSGRLALSWPADPQTQGPVLVWDVISDLILARIPRSNELINAQFVLEGERLVTMEPRQITIWDSSTGDQLGLIGVNRRPDASLSLSDNGRFAVIKTLQDDGTPGLVVWDLATARKVGRLITAENVGPVAVDSGGKYLATGGLDPWVRVWSLADGSLVREFEHSSPIRSLVFDSSGAWLATDDLSSKFRLWSVAEGGPAELERLGSDAWYADFSDDSSYLLFGASDRAYEVVSLPDARNSGVRLYHAIQSAAGREPKALIGQPAILPARNMVVTTDANRTVKVWSIPGSQVPVAGRSKSLPGGLLAALSPDGKRIAVPARSGNVRIYAVGAPGGVLLGAGSDPENLAEKTDVVKLEFSADRKLLASSSMDGRVRVWDAENGSLRDLLIIHPDGAAHDLVFTSSNRYLISASRREAIVSDLETGEVVSRLRIQANHPQLAVADETDIVYIADDLDGVTAWNWSNGVADRIVESAYNIRSVAVTADGSKLVTASDDRVLTLWDTVARQPLDVATEAAARVDDLWIVSDGSRLVVQAGPWLQSFALFPAGISPKQTRMLSIVPAAVQPDTNAREAFVLTSSPSRPEVRSQSLEAPMAAPIDGAPDELRRYWFDRLNLTFDENGQAQPIVDLSATLAVTESPDFR
jgi:WD40 repeat protein